MVISRIERERDAHTGVCVCISSAGRQCPGAGSGLPSSTDGGGACQFVEPRARASCWALRHLRKRQMATRMMTRACAESSRQPHAADASIDVCTGPHDDGEDHGPRDARLAPSCAAALLPPARASSCAHTACAVAQQFFLNTSTTRLNYFDNSTPSKHVRQGKVAPNSRACADFKFEGDRDGVRPRRTGGDQATILLPASRRASSRSRTIPTDGRDKPIMPS